MLKQFQSELRRGLQRNTGRPKSQFSINTLCCFTERYALGFRDVAVTVSEVESSFDDFKTNFTRFHT